MRHRSPTARNCAVPRMQAIDRYLVVVRDINCGRIMFTTDWKSEGISIVAASGNRDGSRKETLLLMTLDATFETEEGVWRLEKDRDRRGFPKCKLVQLDANPEWEVAQFGVTLPQTIPAIGGR
ncbi:MAG: hypothetical protein WB679_17865 [Terracidiphilus sp.]